MHKLVKNISANERQSLTPTVNFFDAWTIV